MGLGEVMANAGIVSMHGGGWLLAWEEGLGHWYSVLSWEHCLKSSMQIVVPFRLNGAVFTNPLLCREAILRLAENAGSVYTGKKKKVSLFVNTATFKGICSHSLMAWSRSCTGMLAYWSGIRIVYIMVWH